MVALEFDPRFGGNPAAGSAVAGLGRDCVISVGGPEIYSIDKIIANYSSPFGLDFGRGAGSAGPGPAAHRSLTGRLSVTVGARMNESLSNGNFAGVPNPVLFNGYPTSIGRLIFDTFIHSWDKPLSFDFSAVQGLGALRNQSGEYLNVILVCPTVFSDPGGVGDNNSLFSGLYVHAVRHGQQNIELGPYHPID